MIALHPRLNAPQEEWIAWANDRYPFDHSDVRMAKGFNVLRAVEDRVLAGVLARGLCLGLPTKKRDPLDDIPPPIDFGYGNEPIESDT